MDKLDKNIKKIIDKIKELTGNSPDITIKEIKISNTYMATIYIETISDSEQINNFILKTVEKKILYDKKINSKNILDIMFNSIAGASMKKFNTYKDLLYYLFNGFGIVIMDGPKQAIAVETRRNLSRGVSEATSEAIVRGPKDGFTENFILNLGLIRRRIKDPKLWVHEVNVGRRSVTKVGIAYIKDIAEENLVNEIIKKIENIDIDAIIDSGYLRELIENDNKSNFPTLMSTERPDKASMALLEGKIVILVDNTPFVLIIPTFSIDYFHTSEDYYQKASNISFIRIIRILAFIISIITPAYYVAVTTHNYSSIPTGLLLNFATQRQGVPFPGFIEALIMMITFEILRESDIRLPSVGGSAVSILGGIVLGDAAVSAGIVSPIMVIVISITAISSLVFSSIDVVNAIRTWRILFLIAASFLGLYGIILIGIYFIIKITSIKSFGKPFMFPFAPFNLTSQKDSIIRLSKNKLFKRNPITAKKNIIRFKNENLGDDE